MSIQQYQELLKDEHPKLQRDSSYYPSYKAALLQASRPMFPNETPGGPQENVDNDDDDSFDLGRDLNMGGNDNGNGNNQPPGDINFDEFADFDDIPSERRPINFGQPQKQDKLSSDQGEIQGFGDMDDMDDLDGFNLNDDIEKKLEQERNNQGHFLENDESDNFDPNEFGFKPE